MVFFFTDTAPTEIYTLSLHDALPIFAPDAGRAGHLRLAAQPAFHADLAGHRRHLVGDRKSTRLNSSHTVISYAVFCLKKKMNIQELPTAPRTKSLTIKASLASMPSTH